MKKQTKWLVGILSPLGALFFSVPTALGLNSSAVGLGTDPVFAFGGSGHASNPLYTATLSGIVASMKSGLVVPAGEDLVLSAGRNSNGVTLYYTISSQYVRS